MDTDRKLKSLVTDEKQDTKRSAQTIYGKLTPREIQIMELVAEGLSNQEIADEKGITKRTVVFHVGNIFLKFGVSSRVEAVIAWEKSNKLY